MKRKPTLGADLRAALVANCLRGALPPVDLRAVCFVRAIVIMLLRTKDQLNLNRNLTQLICSTTGRQQA